MVKGFAGDGTGANHFLSFQYFLPTPLRPMGPRSWPPPVCPGFRFVKAGVDKGLFKLDLAQSLGQGHRHIPSCKTDWR